MPGPGALDTKNLVLRLLWNVQQSFHARLYLQSKYMSIAEQSCLLILFVALSVQIQAHSYSSIITDFFESISTKLYPYK